jgi:hypothetical protein
MVREKTGQAPSTLDLIDVTLKPVSFEDLTTGICPVGSCPTKICSRDLVADVKWLPELDRHKRLRGD